MAVVARVVEAAVTLWVYAVVVGVAGAALLLVGRRFLPERVDEPRGALHRVVSVVATSLLMVIISPLLVVIGIVWGAQATERWGRHRRGRRRDPVASRSPHAPSESPSGRRGGSLPDHVDHLRRTLLAAPVVDAPEPWRAHHARSVGGLRAVGFGVDAATGHDLLMAVSLEGRTIFDTATGERLDRDDEDGDLCWPSGPDLTCPGFGPMAGTDVRTAGLLGGGLHRTASSWTVEVTAPDWPDHRVLLTHGPPSWTHGGRWWLVALTTSELRAAGFSPSGRTVVVATASELWWAARDTAD